MASNPPGKCCTATNFHQGTTVGNYQTVFGLDTYVTGSTNPDSRIVVILTDVYGYRYNNVLLIADQFAKLGNYKVYVPDILNDDPHNPGDAIASWISKHGSDITEPIVDGFFDQLRASVGPDTFIGLVGYCFGAKYVVKQLAEGKAGTAGAIAHPSFVSIEEVAAIKKPLIISAAETDPIFPVELRYKTEAKLTEIGARFQIDLFSGVVHGFACRGDVSKPADKYAMEKALADQIQWFEQF